MKPLKKHSLINNLGKLFKKILYIWFIIWFGILLLLMVPFLAIVTSNKKWLPYAYYLNTIWTKAILIGLGWIPKVEYKSTLDRKKSYLYFPHHNSYIDAPLCVSSLKQFTQFVGKEDINRVPIFGYFFRKIHISINRQSKIESYKSYQKIKDSLKKGYSIGIFPEGSMSTKMPVSIENLKTTPFKLAIQEQIPIVPVTMPYNWKILPGKATYLTWHPLKIVFHDPINTTGMNLEDIPKLQRLLCDTINNEMANHFPPNDNGEDPLVKTIKNIFQ